MRVFANFPSSAEHFDATVVSTGIDLKVVDIDADFKIVAAITATGINTHAIVPISVVVSVVPGVVVTISVVVIADTPDRRDLIAKAIVPEVVDTLVRDYAVTAVARILAQLPSASLDPNRRGLIVEAIAVEIVDVITHTKGIS